MKCKAAHRTGSALSALNATIAFSRKFFRPIPLLKSQNSRSAPPLLTLSKILTDIFRTANNLSICKTTIHSNAGFASSALANAFISCDRSRLFEQDFPRCGRRVRADRQLPAASSGRFQCDQIGTGRESGLFYAPRLIPRVVRHSGVSVQYPSVVYSSYNILNDDRNMWCFPAATAPLSWANQYGEGERRPPSGFSPAHSAPGKTALSEKMSNFFLGDRNYCDRTAPRFTPYFRCAAMCPG